MTDLYDPNISDGRSPGELVNLVKEGQAWLQSLRKQPRQTSARNAMPTIVA